MSVLTATGGGVRIAVQVQPRALIRFLAETLGVPRAAVMISSGQSGRRKSVTVSGLGLTEVARLLKVGTG
jgi:uncharacterized protein YggU (UPF0235/DUF167 family)